MSAPSPAIEAVGLGRDYGSTRALDSLRLLVPRGALVGLLGPNGAGKTTTMLLLATLLSPSRGTARLFGHDIVRERPAVRRLLGLVFQEPSIDGLLTVRENLLFAARLAGLGATDARQAVADALDRTGLTERASQPGRHLSTGWRRLAEYSYVPGSNLRNVVLNIMKPAQTDTWCSTGRLLTWISHASGVTARRYAVFDSKINLLQEVGSRPEGDSLFSGLPVCFRAAP